MITYKQGDLFAHVADRVESKKSANENVQILIPHVCNDRGAWGAGFVIPLAKAYPKARESYLNLFELNIGKLGYTDLVRVSDEIQVVNMIAQHGTGGVRPLRYNHLAKCLAEVAVYANNEKEIHAPMFGSGLAGGDWNFIESLIIDTWDGLDVTIYYLPNSIPNNWLPPSRQPTSN